jgi:hypothetical protein
MKKQATYTRADLLYAYEEAAEYMEQKEFGGDDPRPQEAAYKEVAKRLRRAVTRMIQYDVSKL